MNHRDQVYFLWLNARSLKISLHLRERYSMQLNYIKGAKLWAWLCRFVSCRTNTLMRTDRCGARILNTHANLSI